MIRKQAPGIAGSVGLGKNGSEPVYKSIPILVILEDSSALDPSHNHVMQGTGSIDTRLSRHAVSISKRTWFGRVDLDSYHPGPPQVRTCGFPASGSSNHGLAAICATHRVRGGSGKGYRASKRTNRSQYMFLS
jgi:hypothetical protein